MNNLLNSQKNFLTSFLTKLVLFALILASLVIGFILPNQFIINSIKILPKHTKIVGSDQLKNQNLLFLDIQKVKQQLFQDNPYLEKVTINKLYPQQLEIKVKLSRPVAQIKTNSHYLLINQRAKILAKLINPDPKLINISYYQKIRSFESRPGQTLINQDLVAAILVVAKGQEQNFNLERVNIPIPGQIQAKLTNRQTLITFSSKKNIAKSWTIVHNILRSLKIKGQSPKEINLLFEKPYYIL